MQAKVEKSDDKFMNYHGIIDYSNISKIKLNEKSDKVVLFYPKKKERNGN